MRKNYSLCHTLFLVMIVILGCKSEKEQKTDDETVLFNTDFDNGNIDKNMEGMWGSEVTIDRPNNLSVEYTKNIIAIEKEANTFYLSFYEKNNVQFVMTYLSYKFEKKSKEDDDENFVGYFYLGGDNEAWGSTDMDISNDYAFQKYKILSYSPTELMLRPTMGTDITGNEPGMKPYTVNVFRKNLTIRLYKGSNKSQKGIINRLLDN